MQSTTSRLGLGTDKFAKLYLTEREVWQSRGIGVQQLRIMRARGCGPRYVKVSGAIGRRGGRVLYAIEDLDRWLAQRPSGGGQAA
jgi:hypothetical protein